MIEQRAHRLLWHAEPMREQVRCWNCARPLAGRRVARRLYPGSLPGSAVIEDWHRCPCGSYVNVRRTTSLTFEALLPR